MAFYAGMKKLLFTLLLTLGLLGINDIQAQQATNLEFYYGAECPHCHEEIKWFSELEKMYPDIQIQQFEVWHNSQNKALWNKRMRDLGATPAGVPTNIIGNEIMVGFNAPAILALLEKHFGPPFDSNVKIEVPQENDSWKKIYDRISA